MNFVLANDILDESVSTYMERYCRDFCKAGLATFESVGPLLSTEIVRREVKRI